MPLDRSKPFGLVYGAVDGKSYEQDGRFFWADGSEWTPPAPAGEVQVAPPAAPEAPKRGRPPKNPDLPIKVVSL
jgi:hypothetical protein